MKMEINLEDEFYDEGGSLDSSIIQAIIDKTAEKLVASCDISVKLLIQEAVDNKIKQEIEDKISTLFDNFFSKPVSVSTGWQKEDRYDSLSEMIEKKITDTYSFSECKADNVIMHKINTLVTTLITKETDKANALFKREGERIAKETIEKSNIGLALANIGNK